MTLWRRSLLHFVRSDTLERIVRSDRITAQCSRACSTVSGEPGLGATIDTWLLPSANQDLVRSIYAADVVGPTISLCEPKPFSRHASA